VGYVDDGMILN